MTGVRVWIVALVGISTSIENVRVALVALGAAADMRLSCTIISVVVLAEAVAAAARRRGPIAVACRVVDPPVQHRGKASPSRRICYHVIKAQLRIHYPDPGFHIGACHPVRREDLEPVGAALLYDIGLAAGDAGAVCGNRK